MSSNPDEPEIVRWISPQGRRGWVVRRISKNHVFLVMDDGRQRGHELAMTYDPDLPAEVIRRMGLQAVSTAVWPGLRPGAYHPRVYRPAANLDHTRGFEIEAAGALQVAHLLVADLDSICAVVQPDSAHSQVFGHLIRHTLMLACMEVESSCKAIMQANRESGHTIGDYSRLCEPLRLTDWIVRFARHPGLGHVQPFAGWVSAGQRSKLAWYGRYHYTKHDRETKLQAATIGAMVHAVAAVLVLIAAQFGPSYVHTHPVLSGIVFLEPACPLELDYVLPWLTIPLEGPDGEHDSRWTPTPITLPPRPLDP